jgi:hypothetical protein
MEGYYPYPDLLDPVASDALLRAIRSERQFADNLFLSEAEFDADPVYRGVNPRPGRNLLDRFEDDLGFVEGNPQVVDALSALLGEGYRILDRKLVCGVPATVIPSWLTARIAGNPVNNLGPYVRPEFRDITYFFGIDFHQDLIDFPGRPADMITLYVYLHPVTARDAPLYLLEGSHALGATVFPHDLVKSGEGVWSYRAPGRPETACRQIMLTGPAGTTAMWHGCTLHGTQPDAADHERLSLRYLFTRGTESPNGLDAVNDRIGWPVILPSTREDLDATGHAQIKKNAISDA